MKKNPMLDVLLILALWMTATALLRSQEAGNPPAHTANQESCPHTMDMGRADMGMGFSQDKTTHHFILTKDGGVISVETKDAKDIARRDQIRMHLSHIAKSFADGDFAIPLFVHDQVPPGVPVLQSKKAQMQYHFEETGQGGRIVITSSDPEAVSALHEFLSFQIREHKTGDNPAVQ